jgi:hypothetical protein
MNTDRRNHNNLLTVFFFDALGLLGVCVCASSLGIGD